MTAKFERKWYIIDASKLTVGRLAVKAARVLMGKHKPKYMPNIDTGDYVIIVNAKNAKLTGRKESMKYYFRHSGHPDGDKLISYKIMKEKYPDRILRLAVSGMLPKNKLRQKFIKKLKIYIDDKHPFNRFNPININ